MFLVSTTLEYLVTERSTILSIPALHYKIKLAIDAFLPAIPVTVTSVAYTVLSGVPDANLVMQTFFCGLKVNDSAS